MCGRHGRKLTANQTLFMIPRWVIKRLWIFSCAFTLPSFEGHDLEGHDNCAFFYTPDICHSRRKFKKFQLSVKQIQINAKNIALDSVYLQHVLFFAECLTFCSELVIYAVLLRGHFYMNLRSFECKIFRSHNA